MLCVHVRAYFCPPCLLKAQASATTWPVALLATGTHSMEKISQPNMLDSWRRSSCRRSSGMRAMDGWRRRQEVETEVEGMMEEEVKEQQKVGVVEVGVRQREVKKEKVER